MLAQIFLLSMDGLANCRAENYRIFVNCKHYQKIHYEYSIGKNKHKTDCPEYSLAMLSICIVRPSTLVNVVNATSVHFKCFVINDEDGELKAMNTITFIKQQNVRILSRN